MKAPALWSVGVATSAAAHAAIAAAVVLSIDPKPAPQQAEPETRLSMAAYTVPEEKAAPQATEGTPVENSAPDAPAALSGAIPQSRAEAAPPAAEALSAAPPPGDVLAAEPPPGDALDAAPPPVAALENVSADVPRVAAMDAAGAAAQAVAPDVADVAASDAPAELLSAGAPRTETVAAAQAQTARVQAAAAPVTVVKAVAEAAPVAALAAAPAVVLASAAPPAAAVQAAAPAAPALAETAAAGADLPPVAAPALAAPQAEAPGTQVASLAPPAERMTAALAWSGGGSDRIDPASLAAIQSFMRPGDVAAAADPVRDGIAGILGGVPCSRLQTVFVPETGVLELRGHVPEDGLRAPVLAALRAEVGESLPVNDNLLILPRPQCGALGGISDVGLPQSTDQLTNPKVIGADAHAREYRFAEGDPLALDLGTPDYPAYIYFDYFDADGQVLHLVPNEYIPLRSFEPKTAVSDVVAALNISIGPPFGQEIAVAFAASRPLYDELRPISEPAEPYLAFLKERVAEARAEDPDFKGEWVYFFITTRARN